MVRHLPQTRLLSGVTIAGGPKLSLSSEVGGLGHDFKKEIGKTQ
jgi:hypothetical protein